MFIKAIILILLVAIIIALGMSLYYLIHDRGKGKRTVKALIWRLVLTVALIALLLIALYTGLLHPEHANWSHGPVP